jgi:nucleotide-binding universal stress UspA family protein
MNILLAVDGSAYTERVLAYLAAHEEWLGPRHHYTVLHAVMAVPPRATAMLDPQVLREYYDDEAQQVFEPIRRFMAQHQLNATFVHKVGHAADLIATTARQEHADLLIMGSHGHGSLGNLILGSVATKVMAHCETPVLLVR